MNFHLPSAIAPSTKIPDSLVTQSGWKRISFNIGKSTGSNSSLNTVANTSNAAAEHFPKNIKTSSKHIQFLLSSTVIIKINTRLARNT